MAPARPPAPPRDDLDSRQRLPWERRLQWAVVCTDAFAALLASVVWLTAWGTAAGVVALAAAVTVTVWTGTVLLSRGYQFRRLGSGAEEYRVIVRAGFWWVTVLCAVVFLLGADPPRLLVLGVPASTVVLSVLLRWAVRKVLHRVRARGGAVLRTLVVVRDGTGAEQLAASFARHREDGYQVIGSCVPRPRRADTRSTVPVLGPVWSVPEVARRHCADVVVVTDAVLSGDGLRRLSWALEETGARLVVSPGLVDVAGPRIQVRPVAGLPLLHLETVAHNRGRLLGKLALDKVLGVVLLVLASPLLLALGVLVRLTSPGPAVFSQTRVGKDGRHFRLYKLRTMRPDAESVLSSGGITNDGDGLMFKNRCDPRVTRVGGFLRRYSLDELPQLWNVVRGDMSLVGPRPPLPREVDRYQDAINRRLVVRPGLTGLWQVSGRADLSWQESVALDLRYVDNWSVTMDLHILWRTLRAVVTGRGAY